MPITNTNVTVNCSGNGGTTGGTATQITPTLSTGSVIIPVPVVIYNPGVGPVFVGGPSVVSGNGVLVAPGEKYTWPTPLAQGEILYAIANTVTTTVSITKGLQ